MSSALRRRRRRDARKTGLRRMVFSTFFPSAILPRATDDATSRSREHPFAVERSRRAGAPRSCCADHRPGQAIPRPGCACRSGSRSTYWRGPFARRWATAGKKTGCISTSEANTTRHSCRRLSWRSLSASKTRRPRSRRSSGQARTGRIGDGKILVLPCYRRVLELVALRAFRARRR